MPSKVTLTSSGAFQDAKGTPLADGYLLLYLSGDATIAGVGFVAGGIANKVTLNSTGHVASSQLIWGTDVMTPGDLAYKMEGYNAGGQLAFRFPQFIGITGSSFDLSSITPNGGGFGRVSTTLAGLSDVSLTTLSNAQALVYDTSINKWKNGAGGGGGGGFLGTLTVGDGYTVLDADLNTMLVFSSGPATLNIGPATDDFSFYVYNAAGTGVLTLSTTDPFGFDPSGDPTTTIAAGQACLVLSASNDPYWSGGWFVLPFDVPSAAAGSLINGVVTVSTNQTVSSSNYHNLYIVSSGNVDFTLSSLSGIVSTHPDFNFFISVEPGGSARLIRNSSDEFYGIPGPIGGTGTTEPYPLNGAVQVIAANRSGSHGWFVDGPTVAEFPYANSISGPTSYTLALADMGGIVRMNTGSANTVTVPNDTTTYFPVGVSISVRQVGTGTTTIVAGSGVTVNTRSTLVLSGQGAEVKLTKVDNNTWDLSGDVA